MSSHLKLTKSHLCVSYLFLLTHLDKFSVTSDIKMEEFQEDSAFPGPYYEKNAQLFMQNSCLFDKIKEVENQVDKMLVHWRKLRTVES